MSAKANNTDVINCTIANAIPLVQRCVDVHRPVFLHGPPGIGKSAIGYDLAYRNNRPLIDIRLSLYDPSDLKGIPHLAADGQMHWSQPHELPRAGRMRRDEESFHTKSIVLVNEDDEPVINESVIRELDELNAILFLDELNSAPSSVQSAAYSLMLDRRIGEYTLPKNVSIIAAGNRASDRGVTNRIPAPLANRMAHIEINPVFEDWQNWAAKNGIRTEIIGFLSASRQHWNTFETQKDSLVFATPRSWDFISRTLWDSASTSEARDVAAMYVGMGAAVDFAQYRELALKVPDARKVFRGEKVDVKGLKINILYTMAFNLLYGLRDLSLQYGSSDPRAAEATNNTLIFVADAFPAELAVIMARMLSSQYGVKINDKLTPAFSQVFFPKIDKYLGN